MGMYKTPHEKCLIHTHLRIKILSLIYLKGRILFSDKLTVVIGTRKIVELCGFVKKIAQILETYELGWCHKYGWNRGALHIFI